MKNTLKNIFYIMWLTLKLIFRKNKNNVTSPDKAPILEKQDKCVVCGLCQKNCKANAISIRFHINNNKKILDEFLINRNNCNMCGFCAAICPLNCIIFKEIEKIR